MITQAILFISVLWFVQYEEIMKTDMLHEISKGINLYNGFF